MANSKLSQITSNDDFSTSNKLQIIIPSVVESKIEMFAEKLAIEKNNNLFLNQNSITETESEHIAIRPDSF